MNQLFQFLSNIVHYYPPEYVSLYLLIGLGVVVSKLSSANTKVDISSLYKLFIAIFIGIPVGIFMGSFVILLWPVYLTATIYNRLSR